MPRLALIAALLAATGLAGCDLFGESPEKIAAAREAEGRAIGSACRQAARALEDCFAMNKRADKASIFAGWRDMNDYMRENKMEAVTPQLGAPVAREGRAESKGDAKAESKETAKESAKSDDKAESKPQAKADTHTEVIDEPAAPAEGKRTGAGKVRPANHGES